MNSDQIVKWLDDNSHLDDYTFNIDWVEGMTEKEAIEHISTIDDSLNEQEKIDIVRYCFKYN